MYATLACLYLAGAFNFAKRWVQGWARRPELEVRALNADKFKSREKPYIILHLIAEDQY